MHETFAHTADLGLRVRAPDLDTLFGEAAEALIEIIVESAPPADAEEVHRVDVDVRADRLEWLLADWLSEWLHASDQGRVVLGAVEACVAEGRVSGHARARALDPVRDRPLHEVKAITYHGLKVERDGEGWLAEVIVDI